MSNEQTESNKSEQKAPFNDFDNEVHLITDSPRNKHAVFIEKIQIKPGDQQRMLLGSFTDARHPKGFSVEISPDPSPVGSVLTEIISVGTAKRYKLVLLITNYGLKVVSAEVWQL